jgi:DegV family protein with EDD domain
MTVKILTDSLCDLPPSVAEELEITVLPARVRFGSEIYRDGVDLSPEEFYGKLEQSETLPTTIALSPGELAETYDKLSEETDEILAIILSHKFSASYEAALQAKEQMKRKCRVEVVNSLLAIMAQGLVVITAARAAEAGASLDEVVDVTRRNLRRVDLRVAFDTLEYLKRGGRIGRAQAFLGSMLKVHPIITIRDGEVYPVARERSRAKAIDHLYNFAMRFSQIEEMAVEDGTTPQEGDMLVERLSAKFPKERIYRAKLGPAVTTYVGPRALNVAVLGDR